MVVVVMMIVQMAVDLMMIVQMVVDLMMIVQMVVDDDITEFLNRSYPQTVNYICLQDFLRQLVANRSKNCLLPIQIHEQI